MFLRSSSPGALPPRPRSAYPPRQQGSRNCVQTHQFGTLIKRAPPNHRAQQHVHVRVRELRRSLCNRQSGRMLLNICLRNTACPAICRGLHQLFRNTSISATIRPRENQCNVIALSSAASRSLISGSVSSRIAPPSPSTPAPAPHQQQKRAFVRCQQSTSSVYLVTRSLPLDEPHRQHHIFALDNHFSTPASIFSFDTSGNRRERFTRRPLSTPRSPPLQTHAVHHKYLCSPAGPGSSRNSTSWVTIVPPPVDAYFPTVQGGARYVCRPPWRNPR